MGIYNKNSIYIGPSIYNDGGASGSDSFFHTSVKFRTNTFVDYSDKKIKTAYDTSNVGLGGFFIGEEIDLTGKKKIELQIKYFVNNSSSPSSTRNILSYKAGNANMWYGHLIALKHRIGYSEMRVEVAEGQQDSFSSWPVSNKPANHSYTVKFEIDLEQKKVKVYVDGDEIYSSINLGSVPTYWQPGFFASSYYEGSYPADPEIHSSEYIDMEDTYIKIDGGLILGLDQ